MNNQNKIIISFSFLLLFTFSLVNPEGMTWNYQDYKAFINSNLERKPASITINSNEFCSFKYDGKTYGGANCQYQNNKKVHIQTCGNKGIWCWLNKDEYKVTQISENFCYNNQSYDKVSFFKYLTKLFEKKEIFKDIPNCITGV